MCRLLCFACGHTEVRYACFLFFFNDTATTEIYTLSLHDALPISEMSTGLATTGSGASRRIVRFAVFEYRKARSEEHTSELQSPDHLVCRLLLEKKNKKRRSGTRTIATPNTTTYSKM